jgi:hypothetical protein
VDRIRLGDDPIFVIGHWRTGTTLLHELLALDPRLRAPTNYECLVPNHFLLTSRWLKGWSGFTLPRVRPMDAMRVTWNSPQEDEFALCNSGAPSPYAAIAFPNEGWPSAAVFEIESLPVEEQRRWEERFVRFLKRIVYARAGRLVLKSPTHTFRLPTLLRLFPRAKFINMCRNPLAVFSSTVKLWRSLFEAYGYQKPTYEGLEEWVIETFARMDSRLEATRALVQAGGIVDVRYEDLLADPWRKLEEIYEGLSLGEFGKVAGAVKEYLAERADYVPNRYELDERWAAQIRERWRAYFERYAYSPETGMVLGELNG